MPGLTGPAGPMGMNGTDAVNGTDVVLLLSNVDLFSSCDYFNESCAFTTLSGCFTTPFPPVAEVRMRVNVHNFVFHLLRMLR